MANPLVAPTLGKLISSVRSKLNQPDPANSFWSDSELTEDINDAVQLYFTEVVATNEGQFLTTGTLNVVSGAATVALPSDCFSIKHLYKVVDGGFIPLVYRQSSDEYISTQGGASGDSYLPSYSFRGNFLELNPAPEFSETGGLRLDYFSMPDSLINGGDRMSGGVSPIFKQLIVMYAVYKAKVKESLVSGADTSSIAAANVTSLYAQFKTAISNRSKYPVYTPVFNPEGEF